MTIENKGREADRLLSAASSAAGIVEIHEMKMDGGMMQMREVKDVELKPGATVELKPGGYHVMLMDLKQPLKQGDTVPVMLRFEKAGTRRGQGVGRGNGCHPRALKRLRPRRHP